ncbi:MAG: FAD-linked oxidase [candidate division Zixibacteria bacterium HGW-Zixibacteria-1]|nr:MAG: FAD-linked oxidase [candidate division Zixibacteria bacterium HGW-Zixibacteria-1]
MSKIQFVLGNGATASVNEAAVEGLETAMRGELLRSGSEGYDEARTIWNAMVDKRPALIARCAGASDVRLAVSFAARYGLLTAVRGGGHNIAGNAVCEGGFMIDLSQMRSVRIDPGARVAHVEPGATLGDFDREAQSFGLATPVGINPTTGVAGLTLGGGFGWLSRKYGMTVDNLLAVDIVTADGELLRANEKENPDLFWAVRGGGGNFGVVTRFEFRLHPVGPEVLSGLIFLPLSDAVPALKLYREYVKGLKDETSVWVVLRQAPPLPFLPEKYHGKNIMAFALCHVGDPEEGLKAIEPLRGFGKVIGEHVGVQPFTAWQAAFDPLLTPGARNYWKSHNFVELSDEVIDIAVEYTSKLPSPQCEVFLGLLAGQVNRVSKDATAYSHRDINYVLNMHGRWEEPSDDNRCIGWSRDFFKELTPHASGGVYVNFLTAEETDRINAAYGGNYERLLKIKLKYDPENLFCLNQNIATGKEAAKIKRVV